LIASTPIISPSDSLTYNLTFSLPGEELSLNSISFQGYGIESYPITLISKPKDKNTILFIHQFLVNSNYNYSSSKVSMTPLRDLLINVYHKGAVSPYFSFKFSNVKIISYSNGFSGDSSPQQEVYTITADTTGYKDWTSGDSIATGPGKTIVPY
jgi:hypothetical protein